MYTYLLEKTLPIQPKTCNILQRTVGLFWKLSPPAGLGAEVISMVKGKLVKLLLWDTAGQVAWMDFARLAKG